MKYDYKQLKISTYITSLYKDSFKIVENLVVGFKKDVFLNCDEKSNEFMIGIMKTR